MSDEHSATVLVTGATDGLGRATAIFLAKQGYHVFAAGRNAQKRASLEAEAKKADHESDAEMHVHGRWALATTLLQIAIALSAIALLTRKRWLLTGVYCASAIGVAVGILGAMHV